MRLNYQLFFTFQWCFQQLTNPAVCAFKAVIQPCLLDKISLTTVIYFSAAGGLSAPVLDVNHAMSTVVFVEWSEVVGATFYNMIIRRQDSSAELQEMTVYGESIILTDLSPNFTYCISVEARNEDASGPESAPVCVQTGRGQTR